MVKVRFVGGTRKIFSTEFLELDLDDVTIETLLEKLLEIKPLETDSFDTNNILIAVNGSDSSALNGKMTRIKNTDLISIIPVIHGGSNKKIIKKLENKQILILEIKGDKKIDVSFLDDLRKEFPKIKLQGISSSFILSARHLEKILLISIKSEKEKILLSNKLETDILMRFASTRQITEAISLVGIKPKKNFILIAIGSKISLEKLYRKLTPLSIEIFSKDNSNFLKKQFKITKKQLNSIYSKDPLEDILIERGAILV